MAPRLPLPTAELNELGVPDTRPLCPPLVRAWGEAYVALSQMTRLDPVTKELVRFRNARRQRCQLCMSLRSAEGLRAGVSEQMLAEVDDYEFSSLPERQQVALRLADVFLVQPTELSAELIGQVQENFSAEEIVEILLRLVHWSHNKVMVALGVDGEDMPRVVY